MRSIFTRHINPELYRKLTADNVHFTHTLQSSSCDAHFCSSATKEYFFLHQIPTKLPDYAGYYA